jgi:signal transduction histidine kinase
MEVEYSAFMVAREAVYNALLHGAPKMVRIALDGDADHLCLDVHDDGVGIGENAGKTPAAGHMGMIGMRERSVSVGAELAISPSPDGGTCVHFEWRRPAGA